MNLYGFLGEVLDLVRLYILNNLLINKGYVLIW
jgi:hypothetical protein